jgi:hypothetical protein
MLDFNMASSDKLRLCLLIPRKKGLTEEEFHKYWADVHGPLVTEWLVHSGQGHRRNVEAEASLRPRTG